MLFSFGSHIMCSLHSPTLLPLCIFFCILIPSLLSVSSLRFSANNNHNIHVTSTSSAAFDPTRVTQLSWAPRIFLYKGFLSEEECDHLINLARDKLEKSLVTENVSGKSIASEYRTSSQMFLDKAQDEIITDIEARIAMWTFLPVENGEHIQVLLYEHGQKGGPHIDSFEDKYNLQFGGHRVATVLMYLSNVEKGGETVFPNSESGLSQPKDESWSECAKTGYAVKPQKGDALLFFSLYQNGTIDAHSLHAACPVIEGEKWCATKWIHVRDYDKPYKEEQILNCADKNENCSKWAKIGECKKNPLYMVGNGTIGGHCMKSCNICSS